MTDQRGGSFSERLDVLFREVHPPNRGPYTYTEAAQGILEQTGFKITASALQQLRTGVNKNPKFETVKALAEWFGVPVSYFSDDEVAEHARAQIAVVAAMRDQGIRRVALRAAGLSTESLKILSTVIDQARKLEGLEGNPDGGFDLDG
ncbi:helix-turn-helix transcriptional regulator [Streptacidiphilus anmyonensis]|uniref:helix-turn-helix transcriptional regulator n=1 Tax=Streptacidiphilus anmyonensis TaxID=405782 RepID=UPI0005AA1EAA|nr:helix-turn-helix transcriptional regulator [Streptacidiphilus anmyonensis]